MIDNTWKSHIDFENLKNVQNRIMEVIEPMKEEKRKGENLAKIVFVESSISGLNEVFFFSYQIYHKISVFFSLNIL